MAVAVSGCMELRLPRGARLLILGLGVPACTGQVLGTGGSGEGQRFGDPARGSGSGTGGSALGSGGGGAGAGEAPLAGHTQTRLARLSHLQYDHVVRDLLGLDQPRPSGDFLPDTASSGYDNDGDALQTSDTLVRDYQRSAELLAERAVQSAYAGLVPCDPAADADGCATAFITEFGRKAMRRPLSSDEQAAYRKLFSAAATGRYVEGDAFSKGVRLVIETMLQSPNFLYRVELSRSSDGSRAQLSDHELASRLSFLLWGSMPDPELSAVADAGQLRGSAELRAQATRLLQDARARPLLADFHAQWLQSNRYSTSSLVKSEQLFPQFTAALVPVVKAEAARFVEWVAFEARGNWSALLTSPVTFVDQTLASIYGVPGTFGSALTRVDLDPSQRAGFLTQVGFLAAHAHATQSSPIHRGVFIQRQLLCAALPSPPPGATANLPDLPANLRTNRQQLTARTGNAPCSGCHALINPPGFGLEHYDAIGAFRQLDNGEPIDASAEIVTSTETLAFEDGVSLAHALASSATARDCYVRNWMRYGYGRAEHATDAADIQALGQKLSQGDYAILDLLVDLTQTSTFASRPQELVP